MPSDKPAPRSHKASEPNPLSLFGAGLEFAGATGGLTFVGWWLDSKWSTEPWLMCLGLAVGVIGGTYKIWRLGRRFF